MEKEDRKDHDDTRRRIEQDSRDGQGRQFDGCKIADMKYDIKRLTKWKFI